MLWEQRRQLQQGGLVAEQKMIDPPFLIDKTSEESKQTIGTNDSILYVCNESYRTITKHQWSK